MKGKPSQAEMSEPTNAQSGAPKYMEETNNGFPNPYHNVVGGMDVPAYKYNNPRYWEYR